MTKTASTAADATTIVDMTQSVVIRRAWLEDTADRLWEVYMQQRRYGLSQAHNALRQQGLLNGYCRTLAHLGLVSTDTSVMLDLQKVRDEVGDPPSFGERAGASYREWHRKAVATLVLELGWAAS